jgi:hypothetical protein
MLVILVSFAFGFGLALSQVGLPPMVGFLVAGFAFNMAGLAKPQGLDLVADLGVIRLPTWDMLMGAVLLCLVLPIKTGIYHFIAHDAPIDLGSAKAVVMGMGRIGSGAYDELQKI